MKRLKFAPVIKKDSMVYEKYSLTDDDIEELLRIEPIVLDEQSESDKEDVVVEEVECQSGKILTNATDPIVEDGEPFELEPGEIVIEGQSGREIYANGLVVKNGEVCGIFYKN